MNNPQLLRNPIAKAEMLIRKPVSEVFEAFINPDFTTKFWFTKSSGRMDSGKQLQWEWEMCNISVHVDVKAIELNKRILVEWRAYGPPTTIEWIFTPYKDNATFVSITNSGFAGTADEIVNQALDSTRALPWYFAA
jgi:uncharacterized protein YndB with AHSA1/START domain